MGVVVGSLLLKPGGSEATSPAHAETNAEEIEDEDVIRTA